MRLGGYDIRTVDAASLRNRVAIVTQDVQLFDASVRDEHLVEVLHSLGLGAWFAALPEGLDTQLRAGAGLSAGEAQLIGLGRAFLRDPGLVVLDEASSRVDPATAEIVERALDRLLAGRTVLVIAHRLRAVDRADRVVVLDHGRIVEEGAAEDLRHTPTSRFAQLLELETKGAAL